MFAALLDHFHLSLNEIADLTDYQIQELYFHKRDEDGSIVMPKPPRKARKQAATMEEELQDLFILHNSLKAFGGLNNYSQLVEQIKTKWTNKEANG